MTASVYRQPRHAHTAMVVAAIRARWAQESLFTATPVASATAQPARAQGVSARPTEER